jgi:hypothetical protein
LKKFLETWSAAETIEVIGSDGTFNEQAIMVLINSITSEQKWDFINFARMFEQKYIVLVENDKVYAISCQDGDTRYLGVWWDVDDPSCPGTVIDAVQEGKYTQVFNTGQTWGIQTPEMAKEWAKRMKDMAKLHPPIEIIGSCTARLDPALKDIPSFFGGKLERDSHLARTYPYSK